MIMAASLLIAASPVPHSNVSFAQPSDEFENRHSMPASSNDEIVVTAKRLPGSVETDEQPLETLNTADIAAYGASSLADLLDQISSKTMSGGRRLAPVLLVNGKRVSSPADLAALPPDAIMRLEIYPEKVALEQGFPADQRVVNVVLQKNYSAKTAEIDAGASVANAFGNQFVSASLFQIDGDSRVTLSVRAANKSAVLAKDRGIAFLRSIPLSFRGIIGRAGQTEIDPALSALVGRTVTVVEVPTNGITLADFASTAMELEPGLDDGRTIIPASKNAGFNTSIARPISNEINLSISLGASISATRDTLGLSSASILISPAVAGLPFSQPVLLTKTFNPQPLSSKSISEAVNFGIIVDGRFGRWNWSTNIKWTKLINNFETNRGVDVTALQKLINQGANPLSALTSVPVLPDDRTRYVSELIALETIIAGPVVNLPAGLLKASFQVGGDREALSGFSIFNGVKGTLDLSRQRLGVAGTVIVPITSRDENVLSSLGDLSLTARAGNRWFNDAGTLQNLTVSINWSPFKQLTIASTWIDQTEAPTLSQLGAPIQALPSRLVYDFARGETAFVTLVSGGNADLLPEHRRDFKLEASWKPLASADLNLSVLYSNIRASNSTVAAPQFTQSVENAFPNRVIRDANGRILSVDQRDVNSAQERSEQLYWSLSYSRTSGIASSLNNWSLAFNHRVRLRDERTLREGLLPLDFHNGAAFSYGGGLPRHEILGEGGWSKGGMGLKISGAWRQGTKIVEQTLNPQILDSRLQFSSLLTLNLRAFINLGGSSKISGKSPLFKGARLTMLIGNVLNNVVDVRDANGMVPLSYQPGYLDPKGRTFEISLRKQF